MILKTLILIPMINIRLMVKLKHEFIFTGNYDYESNCRIIEKTVL